MGFILTECELELGFELMLELESESLYCYRPREKQQ